MRPLFNMVHGIYRTADRLAYYRKQAQECRADFVAGKNWRYWRRRIWETSNNAQRDGKLFSDNVDQIGDYLGDAHEIMKRQGCRFDSAGWYVDNYQDSLSAYWGTPSNVWGVWAHIDGEIVCTYVRAWSRDAALRMVREGVES